jgi:L-amino acid N-acyltransferase YncA
VIVRDATEGDLPAIRDIYNALIETTTVAWTEVPESLEQRQDWFADQTRAGWPVLVAEDDRAVIGFAAYGAFRGQGKWPGYRHTVEHTVHVCRAAWGVGVGRALMSELFDRARASEVHVMVGAIDRGNESSIRFHEGLGFSTVARMPEVGIKFGQWLDLVLMQRILTDSS